MRFANLNGLRIEAKPSIKDAICPLCSETLIPKCGSIKIWHWSHKSNTDCDDWYEPESQWHLDWKNEFPKECQEVTIKKCVSNHCSEGDGCIYEKGDEKRDCFFAEARECIYKIHRADIKTENNWVIELQNSSISPEEIIKREEFYGDMVWLLNGAKFGKNIGFIKKDYGYNFSWSHPRKCWWKSKREIYIDFEDYVNELKKEKVLYQNGKIHKSPLYEEYEFYNEHIDDYMTGTKITDYIDDTENHIVWLQKRVEFLFNKIFLIKKIYPKTPCSGWGKLISKEEFLKKLNGDINGIKN